MAFYDTFERLCLEKGITPTQAGRDNGISQGVVSMWKKRGSIPNGVTLMKLCEYFDTNPAYLMGNDMAKGSGFGGGNASSKGGKLGTVDTLHSLGSGETPPNMAGMIQTFDPLTNIDKELLKHGFAPFSDFYDLPESAQKEAMKDIQNFIDFTLEKYKKAETEQ